MNATMKSNNKHYEFSAFERFCLLRKIGTPNYRHNFPMTVLTTFGIISVFIYAISGRYPTAVYYDVNNPSVDDNNKSNINNNEKLCQQSKFISMCSCQADRRGFHQKVIAYSLYGNFSNPSHFSRYVDPIKAILSNISESYPGINDVSNKLKLVL